MRGVAGLKPWPIIVVIALLSIGVYTLITLLAH